MNKCDKWFFKKRERETSMGGWRVDKRELRGVMKTEKNRK